MKICISYPPLDGPGIPLLSQNRQFQWFRSPITSYTIYPVVPAYAATLLKANGYNVIWEDNAADKKTYKQFIDKIRKEKPDLIAIESKTPAIKQHWKIVNSLKDEFPDMLVVLMGDHVTAMPEESFLMSNVDYVLSGGDFDFLLLNLANYLSGKSDSPGSGVYFKDKYGRIVFTKGAQRGHNLNNLPIIDRELTKWKLYASGNGNFKFEPNTYTMVGRDCWWRRPSRDGKAGCTFCSWTSIFPTWRKAKPEKLLNEIENLIDLGVKEVFDDTGTFPVGEWLDDFCKGMIRRGYNKKIMMGCNMRAGALSKKQYKLLKKANFRFILYGLESANQTTIDKLNKGTTPEALTDSLKWASSAGLEPHITIMFGYPWETKEDARRTVDYSRWLFNKGYISTLQATILMPYPGTALYDEAIDNDWLKTKNYDDYDMGSQVLKTPMNEQELKEIVRSCYHSFWSPRYIWRRVSSIKNLDDLKLIGFQGAKYVSKLADFLPKNNQASSAKL